ncbi:PAS domain S-box-containing protein [Dyadobacter sp. BE34]|uniref:histidine kinase n=1 Tax=Dyadobacter fermentans TaxID=94254 RepID=A0ABU1R1L7_9BACT|nr:MULTISPECIES: PAS domain S-box protein [Dyadobacter]MDR6807303.1 PAS domain S-box-containing protein [Dyadobacter fermentans]MDR7045044.1 PAS domain S-box-containing protein [Dyadobacter sp. BE242]MDR7199220.1 PAS domain S-box-containing protein [Dyadobacter sp. BE34]MDR7217180.1 PAS domain S-box-containing protein [Dyadobacter sp. BE31]MDR7265113.1 PAS domain S-box-containing protein [Dyadobacter sp. BE32]
MNTARQEEFEDRTPVASEIMYHDLFALNPQPMWVYDVETYGILDVNQAAVRHYGFTREEFLGMTILALRPETEIPVTLEAVSIVRKHEQLFSSGVYKHCKKNGALMDVLIQSNIVYVNGRKAELVLATDITSWIASEQERRMSEEKFKAIFDHTTDAIVLCDDNGCCTDLNEATRRMLGYEISDLRGICIEDFLQLPQEMDFNVVWKNFLNGEILNGLMKIRRKDGTLITGSFNSKSNILPGLHMCVITDVTESLEKKRELMASERRFKALVQEGADLIAILDEQGNYQFVSESCYPILGIEPGFLVGKNAFDWIHPDDREAVLALFLKIREHRQIRTEPFRFKDGFGKYRWIVTIATNMTDDPAVGGVVANSRDITDAVEKARDLEVSNERYRQQNERLREIAWTQSHVVRAPLTRLMGLVELLQSGDTAGMPVEMALGLIKSSADELDEVIREIVSKADKVQNDDE